MIVNNSIYSSLPLKQKDRTHDENYTPQNTEINPSNLCETLELVGIRIPIVCFLTMPPYTATIERSFSLFETCKDISTLHNGTGKTISLGIATVIYTDTFSLHWTQS